jgi:hypothetical protein
MLPLKLEGAPIAHTRMTPTPMLEALHVRKDLRVRVSASRKRPLMDQLGLQRGEEALHNGLVPTIARPTHGTVDVPRQKSLLIRDGGILAPTV